MKVGKGGQMRPCAIGNSFAFLHSVHCIKKLEAEFYTLSGVLFVVGCP